MLRARSPAVSPAAKAPGAGDQKRAAAVMLTPLVLTLFFLFVLPVVFVVVMSLTNWSLTNTARDFVGFKNFLFVLKDGRFWKSMGNTIYFTAVKIVLDKFLQIARRAGGVAQDARRT